MEQCLSKITFLLGCLNFGEDERYRFEDAKAKSNKNKKLDDQVREISNKTKRVLDELLKNLVEQNELISKIWSLFCYLLNSLYAVIFNFKAK